MINSIRHKIEEAFNLHDKFVSAEMINSLFVTIPYNETAVTEEILGFLLEHNYEALETPRGLSLREKLISTDWRLKEEAKETAGPMPELVAVPGMALAAEMAEPAGFSGSSQFHRSNSVLVTLVVVFAAVLMWLWNGKLSEIGKGTAGQEAAPTEVTPSATDAEPTARTVKPAAGRPIAAPGRQRIPVPAPNLITTAARTVATETVPAIPAENTVVKTYDEADAFVGEFGYRAARKGTKWGFIDPKGEWKIEPIYEDVTPFHDGHAVVVLDGQQFSIDPSGERKRDDSL
ncbi:WG repeat-containing protein [Larkinella soli]|uniref:WG repeat-containing protein n=1 Tax=Larkinella soli TaxID=1770527 RepID=UPI0013E2F3E8|nr:WG repeat-containing protein [Larkinella soli]